MEHPGRVSVERGGDLGPAPCSPRDWLPHRSICKSGAEIPNPGAARPIPVWDLALRPSQHANPPHAPYSSSPIIGDKTAHRDRRSIANTWLFPPSPAPRLTQAPAASTSQTERQPGPDSVSRPPRTGDAATDKNHAWGFGPACLGIDECQGRT